MPGSLSEVAEVPNPDIAGPEAKGGEELRTFCNLAERSRD